MTKKGPSRELEHRRAPDDAWIPTFLSVLRNTKNVRMACEKSGVSRGGAYKRRDNDKEFAQAWLDAEEDAHDLLEAAAWRWAIEGMPEPVIYKGEIAYYLHTWSDGSTEYRPLILYKKSESMIQFLLKGNKPEKYRERVDVSGHMTHEVRSELDSAIHELLDQFEEHGEAAAPGAGGAGDVGYEEPAGPVQPPAASPAP